jgi:hypoxia induced protein
MDTFLTGLLYIAMLAVVITLGFGIFNMYKSDDKTRSRSNKLMRLRVALQFAAVLLIIAIFLVKENFGS